MQRVLPYGQMETVFQEIVHKSWPCTVHPADVSCKDALRMDSMGVPGGAWGRRPKLTLQFDTKKKDKE